MFIDQSIFLFLFILQVLRIRDILVRVRINGSNPLTDPDLTPDSTSFFSDLKDVKKLIFFSYNLPAGTLSSVLKI